MTSSHDDIMMGLACQAGLAYLSLAYKMDADNSHYANVKAKMQNKINNIEFKIRKKLPSLSWVVSTRNAKYLRHNLPHLQYLLNVAIDRSVYNMEKVHRSILALKPRKTAKAYKME
jgi:hypothetical protein